MWYTELQVTSNFSFLRGASHPAELVEQAALLGYTAMGITDRNTFAGIVRAHIAAKKAGIRLIPGCRIDLQDGPSLLAYPTDKKAYAQLSAVLSAGNLRTEKGDCLLYKEDVFNAGQGIYWIVLPPETLDANFEYPPSFRQSLQEYRAAFGRQLQLGATRRYQGNDSKQLFQLDALSKEIQIPLLATNDVHYHHPERRQLQDIVTCIREKCTIFNAGYRLHINAERYLKPETEMIRLFRQYPAAIHRAHELAGECRFSLDQLQYQYPEEITSDGRTPQEELTYLAWEGAAQRYPTGIPEKIAAAIRYELAFMEQMDYAPYFLTVYDIVRFARSQHILCQGRGSAANSTVCYCLGITSVDPSKFDLLFERFISSARNEPPDIDVDFEHERREEVIQYIYQKYGRDRAAIVATVTQQHQKGAIRDVAKAMGISVDTINRLSGLMWDSIDEWIDDKHISSLGLTTDDQHLKKVLSLTRAFMGFPRQLGQHTGGFVITRGKLSDLCPLLNARMENRTCIEWNKDDIDALGFLKIDVLALGMLTCIRKAFDIAKEKYGMDLTLANIPQDDPAVYEMICHADTIGVFQIESRAQQSMLPRLQPRCFYDLVIEVAIVRPGPIQGDMVHPYLRRRNGEEPIVYPSKELEEILGRTLGVPLFQEQAMKIAIVAAGFTPAEADELRRSMATFKVKGLVGKFQQKLIAGMTSRGYSEEYAQRVFKQLEGFGSYGFPESHAASFALLVYISSWLKCYFPDVFGCAILNSLPMGFYQPAQLVADARKHSVVVRPVDINFSGWDNHLEEKEGQYFALRLGFRHIKGLRADDMDKLLSARSMAFNTVDELRAAGVAEAALEKLADADAFRSIGLDRREALWQIAAKDRPVALFEGQSAADASEKSIRLPGMLPSEHVVHDYAATSFSLKAHPVYFVRPSLQQLHIVAASDMAHMKDGAPIKIAGLVLVRQRPGTAKGVCFITIEDETGCANLVVFENIFSEYRKAVLQSKLLMVQGKLQREGEVLHVIVEACFDFSRFLRKLIPAAGADTELPALNSTREIVPSADKKRKPEPSETLFPDARNFK